MAAYTTTYDDLVSDIMDIVESDEPEFVAQIPKIIARAQDNLQRDLGLEIWRSFPSVNTASGVATIVRDDDWLQVNSIFIPAQGVYPEQRKLDWVKLYGASTGVPKYWAEVDEDTIRLAPTPNAIYALEIEVLERAPALSDDNQTNWFTKHAADLLLLGCLVGAETYLVSQARVAEFMALYQGILRAAVKEMRTQERAGYEPTREASRPSVAPGERA